MNKFMEHLARARSGERIRSHGYDKGGFNKLQTENFRKTVVPTARKLKKQTKTNTG